MTLIGTRVGNAETYANWGRISEVDANLGWLGMTPLKSTPIWDDPRGAGGADVVIEKARDRMQEPTLIYTARLIGTDSPPRRQNHFFFLKYSSVATVVSAIRPMAYHVP